MKIPLCFLALASATWAAEPGLLFYVSGDAGTTAEVSAGATPKPTYEAEITPVADGARGGALQCGDTQLLAYRAPGNIYAQRGTLSFFWRSRYPVGPTEFPVFRVGYADHSSWDMVWLRIDYNGHGFDAFVTDASLARTRVSVKLDQFPDPKTWTHLAFAWDETRGVRLYVNGKLAGHVDTTARYDAALDQFGPHSRIISPYQVQSDYNFVRGGDIDEIRIYDRMLADEDVATLAKGDAPVALKNLPARSLADAATRAEWNHRYGFDNAPPLPPGKTIAVRKVEIHDAYDLGRWWWKANDGIRETTWPGVYNRSRLPGRHDYFTLPDWDCYVDSGKEVTFTLPDEPVNQIEISGSAWGTLKRERGEKLFDRAKGVERSVNRLASPVIGGKVTFTNVEPEEPIGELSAFNVTAGAEPAGTRKLAFHFAPLSGSGSAQPLRQFIEGRFPTDERTIFVSTTQSSTAATPAALPLAHFIVNDTWAEIADGLDGIALDLPALKQATSLNIQVKDPLWPLRDMLDFTCRVPAGEATTLWLDLRDRLLPAGKPLYLTIASAGEPVAINELRLVFKPRDAARAEHELDRFTQVRDAYAMSTEEHPANPRLDLYNRIKGDLEDLLRVNPEHLLGRQYAAAFLNAPRPPVTLAPIPAGVPAWAARQVELLDWVKQFVDFYIDKRQSAYGDFGGGISDDVDLLNTWPGVALMGVEPDRIKDSLNRLLDAAYKNGMFTRGLPTIQADELHSYEEGINCLAQNLILDYGNPVQLDRAMETARGIETITGVNAAGHRHIKSSYYSGTKMALEDPWGVSKPYSNLVLQVPQLVVDYNGNPTAKKYLVELADGLLAHRKVGAGGRGSMPAAIQFASDREASASRGTFPWHVFWGPFKWTGDQKYLEPLRDGGAASLLGLNANTLDQLDLRAALAGQPAPSPDGPARGGRGGRGFGANNGHVQWQLTGDKAQLERLYASEIETCASMHYINTEGSLWIDRVNVPYTSLQRARLGGVALVRNSLYPGHTVSWEFTGPTDDRNLAILVSNATPTAFKVIAYNLAATPVRATLTGWNVDPGQWEITQGVDTNNDDAADGDVATRTEKFERSRGLAVTFAPRVTTILTFKLKTPGTPYWTRPDLAIVRERTNRDGDRLSVRVSNLGSVTAPATTIVVRDPSGRVVASERTPAIDAPADLMPRSTQVDIRLPKGFSFRNASLEIDPDHTLEEITTRNNVVRLY